VIVEYTSKIIRSAEGRLYTDPPTGNLVDLRDALLRECREKHNGFVNIRFSTPRRPRRRNQQGLLHDWLHDIAKATGNELGHVKMALKIMAMSEGWPAMRDANGEPIIDIFTGNPLPMSEADATVEEESILMRTVQRFAAEYQIELRKGVEK